MIMMATRSQSEPTSSTLRRSAARPRRPSMSTTGDTNAKSRPRMSPGTMKQHEAEGRDEGRGDDGREQRPEAAEQQHPDLAPAGGAAQDAIGDGDRERAVRERHGDGVDEEGHERAEDAEHEHREAAHGGARGEHAAPPELLEDARLIGLQLVDRRRSACRW